MMVYWGMSVRQTSTRRRSCANKVKASLLDHARDYLALVNHFRSEMPRPIIGKSLLTVSPLTISDFELGFGHSMGGTVLMNVALMHPRLFTTFIGIEPPVNSSQASLAWASAAVVTFRKDTWASKEEAVKSFRTNPFYKRWDERVFERYFRYAFRPVSSADENGPVTLVTSKDQEAANMARAVFMRAEDGSYIRKPQPDLDVAQTGDRPFYSQEVNTTFRALPQFRPSCLYIYGEHSNMGGATAPQRSIRLKTTGAGVGGSGGAEAGRVQERMLKGSHYLPFESPAVVAKCAGSWVQSEMTLWAKKEEEQKASWERVPMEKRSKVDDDWKYWMKETYMKKKPSKI